MLLCQVYKFKETFNAPSIWIPGEKNVGKADVRADIRCVNQNMKFCLDDNMYNVVQKKKKKISKAVIQVKIDLMQHTPMYTYYFVWVLFS